MDQLAFQLDIWSILLGFGALNGYFLAVVLWKHKKGIRYSNRLLSLMLLCISIWVSELIISRTNLYFQYTFLIMATFSFAYLIGPLFYFYARSLIRGEFVFRFKDSWHAIPLFMALSSLIPFYFDLPQDKITHIQQFSDPANLSFRHLWLGGIFLVQTVVYLALIFKLLMNYQDQYKIIASGTRIDHLVWLQRLVLIFFLFMSLNATISFLLAFGEILLAPGLELSL